MKVLLVNGSPRPAGCTYTALAEVAAQLQKNGIETEIFQTGSKPVRGCIACLKCDELDRCVFDDDCANALAEKMIAADAVVLGSPVYYAGPNGAFCALLDRAFYSRDRDLFAYKPAASVVSCRRGGSTAAFDRLNKYITINNMFQVGSQYWNGVHGNTPEEVRRDLEGMQVMRRLGENIAYLLNLADRAKDSVNPPVPEQPARTNFIR